MIRFCDRIQGIPMFLRRPSWDLPFILLLAYLALTGLAVIAFRSGRKALGGGVLAVMAVSTAVLGYLWVTSPM